MGCLILFCRTLCRRSLGGIEFYPIRMQLLSNRCDRFSNTLVGIGPAVLVNPFLQLVYGNSSHDVKGVRHIKIVRGKKPRYPMLYYHIGDFPLLGCKILQALF